MRTAFAIIFALLIPATGHAQSVLDTRIPPNAIDRATAATDPARADASRAAADDKARADRAARAAADRSAPVAASTMTDGASGLGTRSDVAAPTTTTPPPQ